MARLDLQRVFDALKERMETELATEEHPRGPFLYSHEVAPGHRHYVFQGKTCLGLYEAIQYADELLAAAKKEEQ